MSVDLKPGEIVIEHPDTDPVVTANRLLDTVVKLDHRVAYLEKALKTVQHLLHEHLLGYEQAVHDTFVVIDKALKGEESEKGEHAKSRTNV